MILILDEGVPLRAAGMLRQQHVEARHVLELDENHTKGGMVLLSGRAMVALPAFA